MDNRAIALVLAEIADLLEIKGENVFKIRAYRSAADVAGTSPDPVARMAASGRQRGCADPGDLQCLDSHAGCLDLGLADRAHTLGDHGPDPAGDRLARLGAG